LRGKKAEDTKRGRKFRRLNAVAAVTHGKNGTKKTAMRMPARLHDGMLEG
jgi:hypothetical protein